MTLSALVTKYVEPELNVLSGAKAGAEKTERELAVYPLTPLTSIHLHSNKTSELGANGSIEFV